MRTPWLVMVLLIANSISSVLAVTPNDLLVNPPKQYFNDYPQVVPPATATSLNRTLANFERETSNQIMVVIFPEWPTDIVFDDYAQELFRAAKLGQTGIDNGLLILVSIKERKIRIHTGRGLEGALPDALCIRIISDEIAPQFRTGNYAAGFQQGLAAIMAAAKGEYKGNGKTVAQRGTAREPWGGVITFVVLFFLVILFCVVIFVFAIVSSIRRGTSVFNRGSGSRTGPGGGIFWGGGGGGGFSGGGGSSGGGGGGDDNSLSGGGGDSGGGGASGDW